MALGQAIGRLGRKFRIGETAKFMGFQSQAANSSLLKNMMTHGVRNTIKSGRVNSSANAMDSLLAPGRVASKLYQSQNAISNTVRTAGRGSSYALGATAMIGIATMNGGMSAASDQMASRYMRDSRYSSKLLQNRVGKAHGNGSLNIGNHTGLSLSMSRSRHG
jgi:hypothetical protein